MNRWTKLLIVCSLAFNVAFIAIFMDRALFRPAPPGMPPLEKEGIFQHHRDMFMPRMHSNRRDLLQARNAFFQALSEERVDTVRVRVAEKKMLQQQMQFEKSMAESFVRVRMKMNPAEAKETFEALQKRANKMLTGMKCKP